MEWGPPLSKGNKGPGTGIIPTFSTKATDKSFVPFTGTSTTKIRYQWKFTPEAAQKTKLLRAAWIAVMSRNENNAVHVTDILIRSTIHEGTAFVDGAGTKFDECHITVSYSRERGVTFRTLHAYTVGKEEHKVIRCSEEGEDRPWGSKKEGGRIWPDVEDDDARVEFHTGKP